jgi:hypothetical protein
MPSIATLKKECSVLEEELKLCDAHNWKIFRFPVRRKADWIERRDSYMKGIYLITCTIPAMSRKLRGLQYELATSLNSCERFRLVLGTEGKELLKSVPQFSDEIHRHAYLARGISVAENAMRVQKNHVSWPSLTEVLPSDVIHHILGFLRKCIVSYRVLLQVDKCFNYEIKLEWKFTPRQSFMCWFYHMAWCKAQSYYESDNNNNNNNNNNYYNNNSDLMNGDQIYDSFPVVTPFLYTEIVPVNNTIAHQDWFHWKQVAESLWLHQQSKAYTKVRRGMLLAINQKCGDVQLKLLYAGNSDFQMFSSYDSKNYKSCQQRYKEYQVLLAEVLHQM